MAGGELITGFASGDTLDLVGVTETIDNFASGTLTLSGSAALQLKLPGGFTTPQFSATPSGDGTAITVACFAEGTLVLTDAGEVAVENLRPGMLAVSLTHQGLLPVVWIGHRRLHAAEVVRVAARRVRDERSASGSLSRRPTTRSTSMKNSSRCANW